MKKWWLSLTRKKKMILVSFGVLLVGIIIPENFSMPASGTDRNSYNQESFWYYPWGKSGTHKGVDVFAPEGTPVNAAMGGIVVYSRTLGMGGNVLVVLRPKCRVHYYAHLKERIAGNF